MKFINLMEVTGRVEIYKFDGSNWVQVGSSIDGENAGDSAGTSVALSSDGQTVAIGENLWSSSKGRVRIFKFDGSNWTLVGLAIDGENAGDSAGTSVALSSDGQTVAIGESAWSTATGRVRIFKFDGSSWTLVGLAINGENVGDTTGFSVALNSDGQTVAIGEPNWDTSKGRTRVFKFNGSSWILVGLAINGSNTGDLAGDSVALSADGQTVAVGEPYWLSGGNNGRVRIYAFDGSSWTLIGNTINGENGNDFVGDSVALSSDGTIVAIGEKGWLNGANNGRIRVFKSDGSNWLQLGSAINGENADSAGVSIALSSNGGIVAFGEPLWSVNLGRVRVYKYPISDGAAIQNHVLHFKPLNLSDLANPGAALENMIPVYYLYLVATQKASGEFRSLTHIIG
ncbi:hypothetical protein HYV10_03370 [Candidatus Dependentiae bacterium]|nr:hypothetical protein [Candidatus Dependentiae bacterium]